MEAVEGEECQLLIYSESGAHRGSTGLGSEGNRDRRWPLDSESHPPPIASREMCASDWQPQATELC